MVESRTKNSFRNYSMTVFSQIVSILLSFIGRTFFIRLLSIEYLGINGLFTNILSLLSLAELGVGTAIIYMMYKPVADGDIKKVAAYNNLFRKIYNIIGLFIFIVGISLTPFISRLIKEIPTQIQENIYCIYILFVCNSAISYFFTYKRSLLIAYQKEYINNKNIIQFALVKDVVLIGILYVFSNYYIYLIAQILITFASNLAISYKTDKMFPEIVKINPDPVPKSEIRIIVKNTIAMVCHKIGSVIVSGTGNLFISYYVGISIVGIYSNYILLCNCANQIIGKGVNSLTASFGNLVVTAKDDVVYDTFKKIYFINFILAYAVAIFFYSLIEPFVILWIGHNYLLDIESVLIICVNAIFFYQLRIPSQMVINTYGLFWQIKWKSLLEAIVNICCSFFFAGYLKMGINGILLSALISNITTSLWWEPYVALKFGMKKSLKEYFQQLILNTVILLCSLFVLSYAYRILDQYIISSIYQMLCRIPLACLLMFIVIWLIYRKTIEFQYLRNIIFKIIKYGN